MAKFIRIRNNLINLDKVVTIAQDYNEIWQYIDNNPQKWILQNSEP